MISNSGHDERGKYSGGQAGDQGGEWSRIKWYSRPWTVVLRHPDESVRGLIAQLAGEAADNDRIGYDQSQRTTFWNQLKAVGYFPRAITTPCEADCSAGVAAIVKAAGYILGLSKLQSVSQDMYTGNERSALTAAGFEVLTDSKYLTSDSYLCAGDVLLSEGHHTAINLDNGSKVMAQFTVDKYLNAVATFAKIAKVGRYSYGDSHVLPPCADHVTSCDRGAVARPLYDMGYTDQPRGGITVINMEDWLLAHGWRKLSPNNGLLRGDIVLMSQNGTKQPTAAWHTFTVDAVTVSGGVTIINKYDFGSQERINAGGYFVGVPVNQWADKSVYCIFRYGSAPKEYVFTPQVVKAGSTGASQYLANEILKAYDLKGVNKGGKPQPLELNGTWTGGDMAAMCQWKLDRLRHGDTNLCKGPYGAGEIGAADWVSLLSSGLPFKAKPIPDAEAHGPSVLLWQRLMRANGFKGADGKPLTLDATHGANTTYATKAWQKANGRAQTGKVGYEDWRIALRNI